ncbi:MAG TPA: Gfo/Idh/MocA family oxidoreductase [Bryobacterales bacterium]|nr:Gfo/Idh/MocA family oxidoreductase [Bryobacterales bacterium]
MSETISRRRFLSHTAAATAAAPAILRAQGANEKVQVGWIGVGIRGYSLIGILMEVAPKDARVKAVCDSFAGHLARGKDKVQTMQHDTPDTYEDYRKMLEDKSIDAVFIMAPEHLHHDMVIAALKAGKNVYCEKPLSHTIEEGLEMIKAVDESGKKLQTGTQRRSSLLYQRAREIYDSGALGKVTFVRAFWYRNSLPDNPQWRYEIPPDASPSNADFTKFLGRAPKRPFSLERYFQWRLYWDYSGGISTDLLVHQTDATHLVLGAHAPKSAISSGGIYYWTSDDREVPDTLTAAFEYQKPHGFSINYSCMFANQHYGYGEQFFGSDATMEVMNLQDLHVYNETFGKNTPERILTRPEIHLNAARDFGQANPTGDHIKNFIEAVKYNKPLHCDVRCGHEAAVTGHLATMSYRRDKKVFWDADKQQYRLS